MRTLERSAADFLPSGCKAAPGSCDLDSLVAAAAGCRGCDLYVKATQTVFGRGHVGASVMLVGEQPGDEEDVAGLPFVGPAGRELDTALGATGLERGDVWITNAVKHFKFEEVRRGKRIHKKPTMLEMRACRPWLDAELQIVRPGAVLALGASASQALLGSGFKMTKHRGEPVEAEGLPPVIATWHPSAILRAPERADRHRMRDELASDVARALELASS